MFRGVFSCYIRILWLIWIRVARSKAASVTKCFQHTRMGVGHVGHQAIFLSSLPTILHSLFVVYLFIFWFVYLFLWSLLRHFLYKDAMTSNFRMIGELCFERIWKEAIVPWVKHYPGIWLERLRKKLGIVGVSAEIRTEHFQIQIYSVTSMLTYYFSEFLVPNSKSVTKFPGEPCDACIRTKA
jgi:hypothetical protein